MRTTVTLDPDVEELLRLATRGSKRNFKQTLNDGLRRGLAHLAPPPGAEAFVVKARPMGIRTGIDPAGLHDVDQDLDVAAFLDTTRKLRETLEK